MDHEQNHIAYSHGLYVVKSITKLLEMAQSLKKGVKNVCAKTMSLYISTLSLLGDTKGQLCFVGV